MVTTRDAVAARLGLDPASPLLLTALTHSSYAAEHEVESNERLEFLGDAVVDLAIADPIVTRHPELNEGSGSLVRSRVVNEGALANAARRTRSRRGHASGTRREEGITAPNALRCSPTPSRPLWPPCTSSGDTTRPRSSCTDALARDVSEAALAPSDVDPKTRLRQWAEARGLGTPHYEVVGEGPAHSTTYVATVRVGDLWPWARDARRRVPRAKPRAPPGESTTVPELAEVETVRVSLSRDLVGKKFKACR